MNFIAGVLVYHSSPEIAFCLFIKMLDGYDVRSNYLPGLSGMLNKCSLISKHFEIHLPWIHHFLNNCSNSGVSTELHSMELIMGMFGTMLPLIEMSKFFDCFIWWKWDFFYWLLIIFYKEIENEILQLEDSFDIVELVKSYSYLSNECKRINWE